MSVSRPARLIGYSIAVVLLLVAVALAAVAFMDLDRVESEVEEFLSGVLGREVEIDDLEIDPGWTTVVRVSNLRVDNADWAQAPVLLQADTAQVALHVWPLLAGRLEVVEAVVRRPVLHLERSMDGRRSWVPAAPAEAAGEVVAPEHRTEFPAIGRLVVDDGRIAYRDRQRELALEGVVESAKGDAGGGDRVDLSLDGELEGRPLRLRFSGASLVQMRDPAAPYPFDLNIELGRTAVRARGTVAEPVRMRNFDIGLVVEGPNLADVFPLFRIPAPSTPPYRLEGGLVRAGESWRFEDFSGTVGNSDLSGSIAVDYSRQPPYLEGELRSGKLALRDIAGLVGAGPGHEDRTGGTLPDTTVALKRMKAMNANVRFVAKKVVSPVLPVSALRFRVELRNGRAEFRPVSLDVAGGGVQGGVVLDGRKDPPSAAARLDFKGIGLQPFFRDSEFVQEMGGRFTGNLDLEGAGRSLQQFLGSADGTGRILMRRGSLSGVLVEAVGLDVLEALVLVVGDDDRVKIRCAGVDFRADHGRVSLGTALIDTTDSVIVVNGSVDLSKERIDIQAEARAKDFSVLDLSSPVVVSGSLRDPDIGIGEVESLSIVETGDQEDLDCAALLEEVKVESGP